MAIFQQFVFVAMVVLMKKIHIAYQQGSLKRLQFGFQDLMIT
jgi:hypothetical protein